MLLPHITKLQKHLIHLLFSFRYITSSQSQIYLNHNSKRQTNRHLKNLKEKRYIREIIKEGEKEYFESTIYCLGPAGVRYMKEVKNLTRGEIKNRYKDHTRSQTFVDHNLLIITFFLQLRKQAKKDNNTLTFQTKQDYEEGSVFAMLHPDAYVLQENENTNRQFFFEIIDPITPRFVIRKRVRQYVKYFLNNSVESETGEEYPTVLFILPDERGEQKLLKYASTYLEEQGADDMVLKATTKKQVLTFGASSDIWDPVI